MAAYAYDCAQAGTPIDGWISDPIFRTACSLSAYALCSNGQKFKDCSGSCFKTCTDLSLVSQSEFVCGDDCVQGKLNF